MRIGELARLAGVNIQTVRFYERAGLLPAPPRSTSGYRLYAEKDLHRMLFIQQAKELGFSLKDVREILSMRERGTCPCGRVVELSERHLENIRKTIRDLSIFEKELDHAVKKWKHLGQPTLAANEFCTLIEQTINAQTVKSKE